VQPGADAQAQVSPRYPLPGRTQTRQLIRCAAGAFGTLVDVRPIRNIRTVGRGFNDRPESSHALCPRGIYTVQCLADNSVFYQCQSSMFRNWRAECAGMIASWDSVALPDRLCLKETEPATAG
jgi:hypothetical protein